VFLGFLKSSRTYFHLSFLHRSAAFPMNPIHSCARLFPCLEVATIEVGVRTGFIPPSTLPDHSAVCAISIIISVVGRELHSVVICQRITSITLIYKISLKYLKVWNFIKYVIPSAKSLKYLYYDINKFLNVCHFSVLSNFQSATFLNIF
jgi:hypothetical protein